MARNRVIYQSEGLYVSKDASLTGAIDHEQIDRVQSANYSFTINRQDINQFGSLARIDSLVLDPPTVNLDFSYYLTDGFAERSLGFFVQTTGVGMNRGIESAANTEGNFASGHLVSNSGVNFYIITSPDGVDLNQTGVTLDANDSTMGIGNCYISDYSVELAVGSLPTVNVTVEGANMNSTMSAASGAIVSPAVNQANGNQFTTSGVQLPPPSRDGGITGALGGAAITALRPDDVSVNLANLDGQSLVDIDGSDGAHIQSVSISLPLSRTPLDRLGSRFAFAREIDFPVVATLNVSAIVSNARASNLADLLNSDVKEASIMIKNGIPTGAGGTQNDAIQYKMKGLKIDSQSFSSSIGSNKTVDITFSTQIGGLNDTANGVFMSGINGSVGVFD
jgi:hypothetical protein